MAEDKTDVVVYDGEKLEINAKLLKKCIAYVEKCVKDYASPTEELQKFFSKYDYTLEAYTEELRNSALHFLARGVKCAYKRNHHTDIVHLKDKVFSMEGVFPEILNVLAPDIILCDFDIGETRLCREKNRHPICRKAMRC